MTKVKRVARMDGTPIEGVYLVKVPCECRYHQYLCGDQQPESHRWRFNGDFEKPTFRESYLVRRPEQPAEGDLPAIPEYRCHSYVTDGFVEYCHDCTHDLKNQRLPLLEQE